MKSPAHHGCADTAAKAWKASSPPAGTAAGSAAAHHERNERIGRIPPATAAVRAPAVAGAAVFAARIHWPAAYPGLFFARSARHSRWPGDIAEVGPPRLAGAIHVSVWHSALGKWYDDVRWVVCGV